MLTERPNIEGIKRKNIIDMALGSHCDDQNLFREVQD
jgi:hypothetical protein